ncbi:hypothetical protein BCR36DRAFT_351388 [Piromyces finnis]|uniref:Uncharacterized protein n=1 Tax=Piromyces finnis TaxID=1754191 RepID=A0A1Y1VAX3_9FUNG|nr:hypothetical protein BCR36DRAFT_351388 [Piromyces finnis]|eukprot:ORX51512.1 hypothetical protein BCR36DRAFT_351388 [Piromyces finnis]
MESSKITKRLQSNRQLDKARNVVVYIKNPLMYSRSEYERWILNHMFTSINVEDLKNENNNLIEILEITSDPQFSWTVFHSNSMNFQQQQKIIKPSKDNIKMLNSPSSSSSSSTSTSTSKKSEYIIFPHTKIISIAAEYSYTFLINFSSSMSTIDTSVNKPLITEAIEIMFRCLDGIIRPFSLDSSIYNKSFVFEPKIYISVIVEATNTIVIDDSSKRESSNNSRYKVVLQETLLNLSNIPMVIEKLYNLLLDFEMELHHTRNNLDIDEEFKMESIPNIKHHSQNKNSAFITNSLEYALFSFAVSSNNAHQGLVLITDGVNRYRSSLSKDSCRKLVRDNVLVTIIQVGSSNGYIPSSNFGYVVDNEQLRFIALATSGKFLYSSDCPLLDEYNEKESSLSPNFYHRALMLRERSFTKLNSDNRYNSVYDGCERIIDIPRPRLIKISKMSIIHDFSSQDSRFPWDINSQSPISSEILCGYKEYTLNVDLDHVLATRLREGFCIHGVILHSSTKSGRSDKIEIVMNLHIFSNVTIQYSLRAPWRSHNTSMYSSSLMSMAQKSNTNLVNNSISAGSSSAIIGSNSSGSDSVGNTLSPLFPPPVSKYYKIEVSLNILAHHTFALFFINHFESRGSFINPNHENLVSLHSILESIWETDENLKLVASFNSKHSLFTTSQQKSSTSPTRRPTTGVGSGSGGEGSLPKTNHNMDLNSDQHISFWQYINQIVLNKSTRSLVDEARIELILCPTYANFSSILQNGSFSDANRNKRGIALTLISRYFNEWASFVVPKNTFIKFIPSISSNSKTSSSSTEGFSTKSPSSSATTTTTSTNLEKEASGSYQNQPSYSEYSSTVPSQKASRQSSTININTTLNLSQDSIQSSSGISISSPNQVSTNTTPVTTTASTTFANAIQTPTGFCMARIILEAEGIISLCLVFFNVSVEDRETIINDMRSEISALEHIARNGLDNKIRPIFVCKKNLSRILVRYKNTNFNSNLSRNSMSRSLRKFIHEMNIMTPFHSHPILLDYMMHNRWIYLSDVSVKSLNMKIHMHELAYYLLYQSRLEDGFMLVSESNDFLILTREYDIADIEAACPGKRITSVKDTQDSEEEKKKLIEGQSNSTRVNYGPKDSKSSSICSVQYIIFKDNTNMLTITELWMEPIYTENMTDVYSIISERILAKDRRLTSKIYTFDKIHYNSRAWLDEETVKLVNDINQNNVVAVPSIFSICPVLLTSNFVVSLYNVPVIIKNVTSNNTSDDISTISDEKLESDNVFDVLLSSKELTNEPEANPTTAITPVQAKEVPLSALSNDLGIMLNPLLQMEDDNGSVASSNKYFSELPLLCPKTLLDKENYSLYPKSCYILHYFFERELMKVSNSKILVNGTYHFDDLDVLQYVVEFIRSKKENHEFDDDDSTILMKELKYNSCFVRYRDANSFSLAFLPEYTSLQENNVEPLYQYFSVAVFECQRQQPINPIIDTKIGESIHNLLKSPKEAELEKEKLLPILKLIVENGQHEEEIVNETEVSAFTETETEVTDIKDSSLAIQEPETDTDIIRKPNKIKNGQMILYGYGGNRQGCNSNALPISGPTLNFISDIQKAYSHAFIKSIYTGLIQGNSINVEDFEMVLKHCEESSIDIDITSYLDVRTLCRSWNNDTDNEFKDVTQKFAAVLNHHFKLISTEEIYGKNIYFYRPVFDTRNHLYNTHHDKDLQILEKSLEYSETPLFIRLEVCYQRQGYKTVSLPVFDIPSSYDFFFDGDNESHAHLIPNISAFDFGNTGVGIDNGYKATLRIVCMTLPILHSMEDSQSQEDVDSKLFYEEAGFNGLPEVSLDKQEALLETKNRIEWLLKEEVMHGLLQFQPITESILRYVETQLRTKNPFVEVPTHTAMPLAFVSPQLGQILFLQEFMKANKFTYPYVIKNLGGFFYVTEDTKKRKGKSGGNDTKDKTKSSDQEAMTFDLSHSLGISIGDNDTISSDEENSKNGGEEEEKSIDSSIDIEPASKLRFWLIVTLRQSSVQLYYYSKTVLGMERASIMRCIRKAIQDVCERVNRLILLRMLHEKHRASKYLIIPGKDDEGSDNEQMSDEEIDGYEHNVVSDEEITSGTGDLLNALSIKMDENRTFSYGQFACPLMFTKQFPLYWRFRVNQALKYLSRALQPLAIENRKNMYFYSKNKDDPIFYMKLSETNIDFESGVDDNGRAMSPDSSQLDRTNSSSGFRKNSQRNSEHSLILEVYGVDTPGKDITDEFCAMIEGKLNLSTLSIMSSTLLRNVRLTSQDIDFILPKNSGPLKRIFYRLPNGLKYRHIYINYLKQNMLLYLLSMNGSDVVNALQHYYNSGYSCPFIKHNNSASQPPTPTPTSTGFVSGEEQLFGDISFLYNYFQNFKGPSPLESAVGSGIACICLSFFDREGNVITRQTDVDEEVHEDINPKDTIQMIDNIENRENLGSTNVIVEVWMQGSINTDVLVERIQQSLEETLSDYIIEIGLSNLKDNYPHTPMQEGSPSKFYEGTSIISETLKLSDNEIKKFNTFFTSCRNVLANASNNNNPVICELSSNIQLLPWMMENLVLEIKEALSDYQGIMSQYILHPAANIETLSEKAHLHLYDSSEDNSEISSYLFILSNGINCKNRNIHNSSLLVERKSSTESFRSRHSSSDISTNTMMQSYSHPKSRFLNSNISSYSSKSVEDILLYPSISDSFRTCLLSVYIDVHGVSLYTYNWNRSYCEQIFSSIARLLSWHNLRKQLLNNIIYQKLGFFHHHVESKVVIISKPRLLRNMGTSQKYAQYSDIENIVENCSCPLSKLDENNETSQRLNNLMNDYGNIRLSAPLKSVLKYNFIKSQDIQELQADLIQRNGVEFLESYNRQKKNKQKQEILQKVYTKWGKFQNSHNDTEFSSEFNLRSSRLIHSCRTPLLFASPHIRDSLVLLSNETYLRTDTDNDPDDLVNLDKNSIVWFKDLMIKIFKEYVEYLKNLGLRIVTTHQDLQNSPKFTISKSLSVDSFMVYLQKTFSEGVLIVQVGIQGIFVCVDLYTIQYGRHIRKSENQYSYSTWQNYQLFAQECAKFKNLVHVKSFVYDFHLRYCQLILDEKTGYFPLDILDILNTFVRYNPKHQDFARNRILKGQCTVDCSSFSGNQRLFQYILRNPSRYGFRPVKSHGETVACYLSSNFADFNQTEDVYSEGDNLYQYTLVVYNTNPLLDDDNHLNVSLKHKGMLNLDYFLIVLNRKHVFPHSAIRQTNISKIKPQNASSQKYYNDDDNDPLKEYLSASNTLGDVVKFAERRIEILIEKAIRYYSKDSLWRQLLNGEISEYCSKIDPTLPNLWEQPLGDLSMGHWTKLFFETWSSHRRSLLEIDPQLSNLFLNQELCWPDIFDYLSQHYYQNHRQLYDKFTRHLILFDTNYTGYLVHFSLHQDKRVDCELICLNPDIKLSDKELPFVSECINTICFYLWLKTVEDEN